MEETSRMTHSKNYLHNLNFILKGFVRACHIERSLSKKLPEYPFEDILNEFNDEETEVYLAGSTFEKLCLPDPTWSSGEIMPSKRYHQDLKLSDTDFVFLNKTRVICLQDSSEKEKFYAQIDSHSCHPGYVRLQKLINGEEQDSLFTGEEFIALSDRQKYIERLFTKLREHSTSLNDLKNDIEIAKKTFTLHGPALTLNVPAHDGYLNLEMDIVIAIPCPFWPEEAKEWLLRPRHHGWPDESTKQSIVDEGIYLVPVAHHLSESKETEWRLSFTRGEKKLAHSLSDSQRICYLVLKMIYYYEIKPLETLSSYHLKTCMFWMCEETPPSFWSEENLGECLVCLIEKVVQCLKDHSLPNYFVPKNNMIDHFSKAQFDKSIAKCLEIHQSLCKFLLPLIDVYNPAMNKFYDALEAVLDTLGLHPFETKNHYLKPPNIFHQIVCKVLTAMENDVWDQESEVVASLSLTFGLMLSKLMVFSGKATLMTFLDSVRGMDALGLLPEGWNGKYDSDLLARWALELVTHSPIHLQSYCAACASHFLWHVLDNEHNLLEAPKAKSLLIAFVQTACFEIVASTKNTNQDFIHGRIDTFLQQLKGIDPIAGYFLQAVHYLVKEDKDGCVASLVEFLQMEDTLHEQTIKLKRPSMTRFLNYPPNDDIYSNQTILGMYTAMMAAILDDKEQNVFVLDIHPLLSDKLLCLECEYAEGELMVCAGFLAKYLLTSMSCSDPVTVVTLTPNNDDPHQVYLAACQQYMLKQYQQASELFHKVVTAVPIHTGAIVFSLLCQGQLSSGQSALPVPAIANDIIPGLASPSGMPDNNYLLSLLSFLSTEELALLTSVLTNPCHSNLQEGQSFLAPFVARRYHVLAHQSTEAEIQEEYLAQAEKIFQINLENASEDPLNLLHHLHFLLIEKRLTDMIKEMKKHESALISCQGKCVTFHATEKVILQELQQEALEIFETIPVMSDLLLLGLRAPTSSILNLFLTEIISVLPPDQDFVEKIYAYSSNFKPSHYAKVVESINFNLLGDIHYLERQYDVAREVFIRAANSFQKSSKHAFTCIRQCEDKQMSHAMACMLQGKFAEAYEIEYNVWQNCLPRCGSKCSLLLHFSEELLDLAREDERALRLSLQFLQYILDKLEDSKDSMPDAHILHAKVILGCLHYWMSEKATSAELELQHKQNCEECLKEAALLSGSGNLYTHLGNFYMNEKDFLKAVEYLDKAIAAGKKDMPLHDVKLKNLPHHLMTQTHHFRTDYFMPLDQMFEVLTCSFDDHHDSYLICAHFFKIQSVLALEGDPMQDISDFQSTCDRIGFCPGKFSLLGHAYFSVGLYEEAAKCFQEEKGKEDFFGKTKVLAELKVLSQCCSMLKEIDAFEAIKVISRGWVSELMTAEKELIPVNKYNYKAHQIVGSISLAIYMATELPKHLNVNDPATTDKLTDIYTFIHDELAEVDHMVNGMSTNLAILLNMKYDSLPEGPEKDAIGQRAFKAFTDALYCNDASLTTTRLAFTRFLLSQGKIKEAIGLCEEASAMAKEHIGDILSKSIEEETEISKDDQHMLNFYLEKSLIPASDYLVICHVLQHDFSEAFDVVDALLAYLHRTRAVEVDPVAYLIKYSLELSQFGAPVTTVISFHEATVDRYPASPFIPTIHNNMGCMLFAHAKTLGDHAEQDEYLEKAKNHFLEALNYEGITMAIYADYANFLYNTQQYEAALTVICESDDLPDSAQGSNAYSHEEVPCVDDCIAQLIHQSSTGKFLTDSHFYIQYLRVATLIALGKEEDFIESEIKLLQEDGEEKDIKETEIICDFLRKKLRKDI